MVQNLFSVLSQEQLDSLTKEERTTLTRLDEKLFPNYPEYVEEHMRQKSVVDRVFERRRAEEESDLAYSREIESQFV